MLITCEVLFKDKFRTTEGCKQLVGLLFNIKGESRTVNWLEQALDLLNYLVEDGKFICDFTVSRYLTLHK